MYEVRSHCRIEVPTICAQSSAHSVDLKLCPWGGSPSVPRRRPWLRPPLLACCLRCGFASPWWWVMLGVFSCACSPFIQPLHRLGGGGLDCWIFCGSFCNFEVSDSDMTRYLIFYIQLRYVLYLIELVLKENGLCLVICFSGFMIIYYYLDI